MQQGLQNINVGDRVRVIADPDDNISGFTDKVDMGKSGIVQKIQFRAKIKPWDVKNIGKVTILLSNDEIIFVPYNHWMRYVEVIAPTEEEADMDRFSSLKDKNEQLFNQRYQNYGEDGGNIFWSDKQSQYDRFELLTEIVDLKSSNKESILDVGAGFGDYLDFLHDYNITIGKYVGIDIIPAIIEVAERNHRLEQFEIRDQIR